MDKWKCSIDNKEIVVGVLGRNYVRVPLVRELASAGMKVIGFDVDKENRRSAGLSFDRIDRSVSAQKHKGELQGSLYSENL